MNALYRKGSIHNENIVWAILTKALNCSLFMCKDREYLNDGLKKCKIDIFFSYIIAKYKK